MNPRVSIIVPCYNERTTIRFLLEAVLAQTYPRSQIEVVIADGGSQDDTVDIIRDFHGGNPDLALQVVENERRTIPSALNLAIAGAHGEVIVRLDAHSMPIPEYVARCVAALEAGQGTVVGGVWMIRPGGPGWIAQSISVAAAHPLGVGDALYRLNASAGPVDTVPFGSFRRELIGTIGGFDESLLANEDYEFNTRVREQGGTVWLDPQIRSTYIARSSLTELARQYWRYGYWKLKMLRRYPSSIRWRQALPPLFVASLAALASMSLFWPLARYALLFEFFAYSLTLAIAGMSLALQQRSLQLVPGFMLAVATMHLSWGSAFLWSLISGLSTDHG